MEFEHLHIYPAGPMTENEPRADQPAGIRIPLKPHQLTSLYRMKLMEKHNCVRIRTPYGTIETARGNIGFLGDLPGYGKTLTTLALIAGNREFHHALHRAYGYKDRDTGLYASVNEDYDADYKGQVVVPTTLIVAPKGLVFEQWRTALTNHTTLRWVSVEKRLDLEKKFPREDLEEDELRAWFQNRDVVLLSSTFLCAFLHRFQKLGTSWSRVVIDEAHDIEIPKLMDLQPQFLWLVTASYRNMSMRRGRTGFLTRIGNALYSSGLVEKLAVVNRKEYVDQSFLLPNMEVLVYRVKPLFENQHILNHFLDPNVREMLAANDLGGVARALGGQIADENANLLDMLTQSLQRRIENHQRMLDMYRDWQGPDREAHMTRVQGDLRRAQTELEHIQRRLEEAADECPMCYDTMDVPVTLPCIHRFCGQCIFTWLSQHRTCPMCREAVAMDRVLTQLPADHAARPDAADPPRPLTHDPTDLRHLTKNEAIIHLVQNRAEGKFLLFSRFEGSFHRMLRDLRVANITVEELKGTPGMMQNVLQRFQQGETRVIVLNTQYAGSGIDLSMATDVILYHRMPHHEDQAIARAQRVGRTTSLRVHKLHYADELEGGRGDAE